MAVIYTLLNKPIVLQYKQLFSDARYRKEVFNLLNTNKKHAEKFCKKIIKQVGFALSKEPMQNLKDRDIAVMKKIFEMYSTMITENTEQNVHDLSNLWLNKTRDFLMQCVRFLHSSEICSESLYWQHCTDINKHTPTLYTCSNFQNCLMITNCLELALLHFNFSPTIESAQNHPDVHSREHHSIQCTGIGFVSHYSGMNHQQIEKKNKLYGINWIRGEKYGAIDSLFDLYGRQFAIVNARKRSLFKRNRPLPLEIEIQLFPDDDDSYFLDRQTVDDTEDDVQHVVEVTATENAQNVNNTYEVLNEDVVVFEVVDVIEEVAQENAQHVNNHHEIVNEEEVVDLTEDFVEVVAQENAQNVNNAIQLVQEVVELSGDDEAFENENDEGPPIGAALQENGADVDDDDDAEIIIIQRQIDNQMDADAMDESQLAQLADVQDMSRRSYNFYNFAEHLTAEEVNSGQYARALKNKVNALELSNRIQKFEDNCNSPKEMKNGLDVNLFKKASVIKMDKHVLSCVQSKKLLLEAGKKHFNINEKTFQSKDVQKMLEDRSEVVCMICTYKIEKDENIFEDVPLIAVDKNDDCTTLNILHTSCLQRGIDSAKKELSDGVLFHDWENVWLDKSIEQNMHGLKCLTCRQPLSDIFTLVTKKEQKNKDFQVNKHSMTCVFCLEFGVTLEHVQKCVYAFGITQKNTSEDNCDVLSTMDSYFGLTNIKTQEFVETFGLKLKENIIGQCYIVRFPYISEKEFSGNFQKNVIKIKIDESTLSFKSSTVFLLLKSLCGIVTAVKRYQVDGKNEAALQVMKDDCTFFICAFLRNAKTILHKLNCDNQAFCLSGIDSNKVRKLMKHGCEVLKVIIVQHIGLFDCIQRAVTTVEVTKQKHRKVMNALALKFNATSFTRRAQIIEAEKFDFRSNDQINTLLGDKVKKFENTAGKLYETNPETFKRKSNDTLNVECKKSKKMNTHIFFDY